MKRHISDGLSAYLNQMNKPWHMPGHKRKSVFEENDYFQKLLNRAFVYDVTEVPGLDDYHAPEEMMLSAEAELSKLYNTDFTRFLINGATAGILTAAYATANIAGSYTPDDTSKESSRPVFLVARNCHKSVFHAMELLFAEIIYLYPEEKNGIYGGITKESLENALRKLPKNKVNDIAGCIITSPTYEGILSDLSAISRLLHFYNIPLIVDEAHGAHFPFLKKEIFSKESFFEESSGKKSVLRSVNSLKSELTQYSSYATPGALDCGADIVIQSLHKTLPSFTQTAILHYKKNLATNYKAIIQKYLSYFQTSSPSYILLAAMEQCVSYCDEHREKFVELYRNVFRFRKAFEDAKLENISLFSGDTYFQNPYLFDPSRIVLLTKSGETLKRLLEERYGLVVEMAGVGHVTIISSILDDSDDFDNLLQALCIIDTLLSNSTERDFSMTDEPKPYEDSLELILSLYPRIGEPASHSYYIYPPGVPIIASGELITEESLNELTKHVNQGRRIHIL